MAPLSIKAAKDAVDMGMTKLKRACRDLERNLPPPSGGEDADHPEDRPRDRAASISACAQCVAEIEALEPGARDRHACTHRDENQPEDTEDARSTGGSEHGHRISTQLRRNTPKLRVVRDTLSRLDTCLDNYEEAVARN